MESTNIENGTSMENKSFKFTGKGGEYFAIWVVNVALTILTLGIYSAWAKVRTNQYFYGNTVLDGASFRYTAKPMQILKGRIIAFVLFVAYSISTTMSPLIAGGALIILMLLMPAFLVMSMSFRLRNSVYRNVRFDFDKNFLAAYKVFSIPVIFSGAYIFVISQMQTNMKVGADGNPEFPIMMFVLLASIFLMIPWWEYMITKFKIVHIRFGEAAFDFSARTKNYYGMYLKIALAVIGASILIGVGVAGIGALLDMGENQEAMMEMLPFLVIFIMLPFYLWLFAYLQTKRTNLVYNNLQIDGHKTKSELKTGYMMYLYFTNTLAMMLTLGLLMPWAKVRTARYKLSVTSVDVMGDLGQFTAAHSKQQSAIGEEMGEMFDMDLGF